MLPVLQIGPLAIQTHLLILLLAAWAGLEMGARVGRRLGLDGDHIYNLGLSALTAGLLAGRLGHVFAFWSAYRSQPIEIIGLNPRAFLLWPAVLAGVAMAAWYVWRHRLPPARLMDSVATGLLLGVSIFSLGELLTGRNPGAPSQAPWAISVWGVSRHPTPLYEAAACTLLLYVLIVVLRRRAPAGTAAWVALLGYGLLRWMLEPFRAESFTVLGGLRAAQVLGMLVACVAALALRRQAQRS